MTSPSMARLCSILISGLLATTIANLSRAVPATTNPRCVYPDPSTLLGKEGGSPEKVDYLLFDTKSGPMRWLFLSWEDPRDGMAFLLACDGQIIDKRRLGYITSEGWGDPRNTGTGTAVEVTTTSVRDERILVQSESWLKFNGRTIAVQWTHDDTVAMPGSIFDTYTWSYYYPPRDEILVTGKRTAADGTSVALPSEKYCFRSNLNRFVRC